MSGSRTRIIINSYSQVWQLPLAFGQILGLSTPLLTENWLTVDDIENMLGLTGFEVIRHWPKILWPFNTPIVSKIFNKYVVRLWPFFYLALTNFIIARKRQVPSEKESLVSVIIPARNEAGNIEEMIRRTPEMGRGTELVFVEGNSRDHTYEAIEKAIAHHPEKKSHCFKQKGKGKGDAVRLGFRMHRGISL